MTERAAAWVGCMTQARAKPRIAICAQIRTYGVVSVICVNPHVVAASPIRPAVTT